MATANAGTIIGIVVVIAMAVIFLPRMMKEFKGFNLNTLFSGGGGAQASTSPSGGTTTTNGTSVKSTGSGSNYDIDVSGNGCACANGVCKGNCADMESIDLKNFDPLDWVEQNS